MAMLFALLVSSLSINEIINTENLHTPHTKLCIYTEKKNEEEERMKMPVVLSFPGCIWFSFL